MIFSHSAGAIPLVIPHVGACNGNALTYLPSPLMSYPLSSLSCRDVDMSLIPQGGLVTTRLGAWTHTHTHTHTHTPRYPACRLAGDTRLHGVLWGVHACCAGRMCSLPTAIRAQCAPQAVATWHKSPCVTVCSGPFSLPGCRPDTT